MASRTAARWVLGVVLALASASVVVGEGPPAATQELTEEIVVTASLTPVERDEVGSSVTVIGPEEIAARAKSSVLELLRTVPGLAAFAAGGPGRAASVFVRGANSSHTLVLIDGVRVNSVETGAYDFADLRVEQIERIEVLRGPQSSLYGSEAIGGVINIVTRRGAAGVRGGAAAEAGTKGASRVRGSSDGAIGRVDFAVSAAAETLPGYSLASAAAGDDKLNPYENTTAVAQVGLPAPGGGRLQASFRSQDATVHPDGFEFGRGPVPAPFFAQHRRANVGALTLEAPAGRRWRHTVRIGVSDENLAGEDPETGYNNFRIDSRTTSASLLSTVDLPRRARLTAGYAYERRAGRNAGAYDETADIRALFAEARWSASDRLHLGAAVRNDEHTAFGGATTYRLTAAVLSRERSTRLHASLGTGFKAPTFVDLYYPYYGNPGLRPERSQGVDLGVEQAFAGGRVNLDVTMFHNSVEDLINFEYATLSAANIDSARMRGVETALRWTPIPAVAFDVNYTYTDAEDRRTHAPLARRPAHQAALLCTVKPTPRLTLNVTGLVVRERWDADGARLDDYSRVDAAAQLQLSRRLTGFVRADNLFDQRYAELAGYRSPGLLASAGLGVTF